MARGWESKEVESQQESALERAAKKQPRLTAEQIEIEKKRDSLELQRKRLQRELENCKNDHVRKTLEDGLAYLEAQLGELQRNNPGEK